MIDLPNLTQLLKMAPDRPWISDGVYIAVGSGPVSPSPWALIGSPSKAKLLVLAANNFEAVITELSVFAMEGHTANCGPFETCTESGCARRRELLAKIEREAGEK